MEKHDIKMLMILFVFLSLQIRWNEGHNHHYPCPKRDGFYAFHNGCNYACAEDRDCIADERCLCDQKCGLICVNEAKDCSQPRHSSNGYVILPDPPINNFGQTIRFGCQKGVLYGSETLRCLSNGNWSGPIPQCFEENASIPCELPPPSLEHASWTRNGSKVTYTCNESYDLDGEADIICSEAGSWSPFRGQCLLPTCEQPGRSANMIQIGLNYSVLSTVYYKCEVGYILHGAAIRTCLEDLTWSGISPVCLAKTCPLLIPGTNMTIKRSGTGGSYVVHEVVQFTCAEGFTLTAHTYCTCQTNSQWSCGSVPSCTVIRCQLSNPTGRLRFVDEPAKDWLSYNESIRYKCIDRTMVLHGDAVRTCSEGNQLNGPEPSCKFKCEEPGETPSNARRMESAQYKQHGGYIIFICLEGYRMIGSNRFECQDGQWTAGDFPKCVLDASGFHDYQIRVSDSFTMVNETVIAYEGERHLEMSCMVRYRRPRWYFNLGNNHLYGSISTQNNWHKLSLLPLQRSMSGNYSCVVRGDSGRFVNISLVVRAWCPDVGPMINGARQPSKGIMQVGDFVNFECNTGYHISGMSTIGCTPDGTWSGPKPTCDIDNCEMNLPSVLHSVLIERTYDTAEKLTGEVTVSCKIGFERMGDEKMSCKDAQWTVNIQPSCQKHSSVTIRDEITEQLLEHGTVVVKENDTLHLSCTLPGISTVFKNLTDGQYYSSALLMIEHFAYEDVGKYACKNEEDDTTLQVIDVKILPKCTDIRNLENGYVSRDASKAVGFYHGDTIDFKCNVGYQMFGSSECLCYEGKWITEIAPPICLPDINVTIATDPRNLHNGEVQQYEGQEIILTCMVESSYSLDDLINKYSFGWTFKGTVDSDGTFYQQARFEKGLRLRLRNMIEDFEGSYSCGTNLTQAKVYVKLIKACPDISHIANGQVKISVGIASPRVASFACNHRYRMEGPRDLHCLANGQWDGAEPICKAAECVPITILNGQFMETSFSVGSTLSFECNEGFSVSGSKESLECLEDGNWNRSAPVCTALCDQTSCPFGKKCQVVDGEAVCVCREITDCLEVSRLSDTDRVCGSNAETYPSSCHLEVSACAETGSTYINLLHRGTCEIGGRCRSKPISSYRAAELRVELDSGKYYFNGRECLMAPFGYGLQMGTGFADNSQCTQSCIRQNYCLVPHVEGPCDKSVPRWAYDVGSKGCVAFNYSGCGGNENNFVTEDQCIQTCPDQCLTCERSISLSSLCSQNTTFILSRVTRVHSYETGITKFLLTTTHVARPEHKAPMNDGLSLDELSQNRNQDVCFCPILSILTTPYLISINDQVEKISDPSFAEPWDLKLQTQFLATRSCFSYIGKLTFDDVTTVS